MEKSEVVFASFILLLVSLSACSSQHWSYGFQPGGKRDAENLIKSFQEDLSVLFSLAKQMAEKMGILGEVQHFGCKVPHQRATLRGLKGVLASLIEGENPQKTI
ncbi:Progonadoliberin-1 [Varanus komodoensis]|nr:Progonadoliberin-1 [Varanus komodoensis]